METLAGEEGTPGDDRGQPSLKGKRQDSRSAQSPARVNPEACRLTSGDRVATKLYQGTSDTRPGTWTLPSGAEKWKHPGPTCPQQTSRCGHTGGLSFLRFAAFCCWPAEVGLALA